MNFLSFKKVMQNHISRILKNQNVIYSIDLNKDELWELYLDSFPPGTNEIFRESREYDCSCCRHFIKSFGNIVVINKDNEIVSIWDFKVEDNKYQTVVNELSSYIKSHLIKDIFITKEKSFGVNFNFELIDGKSKQWEHFYIELPERFISKSSDTVETQIGKFRDIRNVLKRSFEEISNDSIEAVLDLISQKSLYKGDEWKQALKKFLSLHNEYNSIEDKKKRENYCWIKAAEVGPTIGKIKNHSIGVLLTDITNSMELDQAVKRYEKIVAPSNYKRPKAIYTKKMVEQAKEKLEELGLIDSLNRKFATIEDITINNILFANKDSIKKITGNDVFDEMIKSAKSKSKKLDKVEEVPIEYFIKNILPNNISNIEVLFENKHIPNLVSLIGPENKDCRSIFKWNNNFCWAYNGNITDSSMRERVKSAGGNIDGILRFSIQWNENHDNTNDFDAHCIEPNGNHIYFSNKGYKHSSSGMLDVDIIHPNVNQTAVENITWTNKENIQDGVYQLFVHNYAHRGGRSGFSAEIEYEGQIYSFRYDKEIRDNDKVIVAEIKLNKKTGIEFIESLPNEQSSRHVWGIPTNQFQIVSTFMFSPNYWDKQKGIGHKHYFFMINNCINENKPNGFFNEFLRDEFIEHRKVFEALGGMMKVEDSSNQLSGLGFSSTKRNSLVCKLDGSFTRTIKIIF